MMDDNKSSMVVGYMQMVECWKWCQTFVRIHKKHLRSNKLKMSIDACMMRTLMVENFINILKECIQRSPLIDIMLVIDNVVAYIQKHALEVHWI